MPILKGNSRTLAIQPCDLAQIAVGGYTILRAAARTISKEK